MTEFSLRFDPKRLREFAKLYDDPNEHIVETLGPHIKNMEFLDKETFTKLMGWKTPRTKKRVASVDPNDLRDVTKVSFGTKNERLRIEILRLLDGVDWPTASVILHFRFSDRYPIIDFRALWSLSHEKPPIYSFSFWSDYSAFCRALANEHKLSMRELDMALWQYSKMKQK